MNVLLVSYKLKNTNRDYTSLYNQLKTATSWWHYLDSCWLLKTNRDTKEWNDLLKQCIDKDKDYLFVVEITNNYQGWLPRKAWDWIHSNIPDIQDISF